MSSLLLILLSAVLICHYAPLVMNTRFFEETAIYSNVIGTALATFLMLALIAPLSYGIEHFLLRRFDIAYLHIFILVIVIMMLAPAIGAVLPRLGPWTPRGSSFALLLTCNTGILGVALTATRADGFAAALWSGAGIGAAFAILLLAFTTLHERLIAANIPRAFRDTPVALITVGLMALALMGLTGLVRD